MKEQYYIDWINSLDIKDSIFVNSIEDLYRNDNDVLLNIISIILNKKVDELTKGNEFKNLNYIHKLSIIMKKNFGYIYETNNEINLKNNTILLIKFLKPKFPNNIKKNNTNNNKLTSLIVNTTNTNKQEIKERPKSTKILRKISDKKLNDINQISEIKSKKMEEFILKYLYEIDIINMNQKKQRLFMEKINS